MSIKIYDGMILTEPDIFVGASKIREILEPIFYEKFDKVYQHALTYSNKSKTWSDFFDHFFVETDNQTIIDETRDPHRTIYNIMKKCKDASTWQDREIDIFYDVCFMPNMTGGNPLVLMFSGCNSDYIEALQTSGIVKDYGYWDNTDPDENVSAVEWRERKMAWSVITHGDETPASVGLRIDNPSYYNVARRYW